MFIHYSPAPDNKPLCGSWMGEGSTDMEEVTCDTCLYKYRIRYPSKFRQLALLKTVQSFLQPEAAELIKNIFKQGKDVCD